MQETVGQRLKRERESRYLSLEKAAEETRIRRVYLQALEADDYSAMPSAAQGRGFLRNYAAFLDIDVDELIAEIQRNPIDVAEVSGPLPQVNLAETEIPPLTGADEKEESAPPLWTRFLSRRPQRDSNSESTLDGEDALFVEEEAKQSWGEKIRSLFKEKFQKKESDSAFVLSVEDEIETPDPADETKASETPADAIMAEIGAALRERRELISLTVEEVERHTHLRAVFVKALEEGAFDKLPSTVQTRGMLSNYSSFLDLDSDALLLRYADALQARRREKYSETPREKIQTQVVPSMPALRTFIAGDLFFGAVIIAAIVGLALWGFGSLVNAAKRETPTSMPVISVINTPNLAEATPSFVATLSGEESATPVVEATIESDANVAVNVYAVERVFVRISADGKLEFEGRFAPNESRFFEADEQVAILTGNGSALRITYNGTDLGLMGGLGEVVNRIYLVDGVATPTATVSPTPTLTPQTTPTFTPTFTPAATGTPTP
ncbi:MAG: DUF4115 domain-containing protein [Anaerolineales bacterium]|nr:DUF4115 domain-containing protein [Anaerolineales bacterium]